MGYPDRAEVVVIRDSGGQIANEEGKKELGLLIQEG
jgi:hypothetical protein